MTDTEQALVVVRGLHNAALDENQTFRRQLSESNREVEQLRAQLDATRRRLAELEQRASQPSPRLWSAIAILTSADHEDADQDINECSLRCANDLRARGHRVERFETRGDTRRLAIQVGFDHGDG